MLNRAELLPADQLNMHAIIDEGRLDETFVDAVCDPPEVFTYGGMIAHVLTFAAHRRTLVCGALADAGITDLGAGDPMRWIADRAAPPSTRAPVRKPWQGLVPRREPPGDRRPRRRSQDSAGTTPR